MIYDCFTFFNELDILELRLSELYDVVDRFVLVESAKTHANQDKELYFENNKTRFQKYLDKIEHVIVTDLPEYKNSWTYENFQRNCIADSLVHCNDNDLVLISDVDEIPKAGTIKNHVFETGVYRLVQDQYFFFYNYRDLDHLFWTGGTVVFRYEVIRKNILNERKITYNHESFPAYLNKGASITKLRLYDGARFIYNGGWHFSYLGGVDAIFRKVKAFAHQELNNPAFLDKKRIEDCLASGKDIFGRGGHHFVRVNISEKSHPASLHLLKEDTRLLYSKVPVHGISFFSVWYQLLVIKLKRSIKRVI